MLIAKHRNLVVFVALLALALAQAAAQRHALSHLGDSDTPTLPGEHFTICKDCVSHAPLLGMGLGAAIVLFVTVRFQLLPPRAIQAPPERRLRHVVRARAPPR